MLEVGRAVEEQRGEVDLVSAIEIPEQVILDAIENDGSAPPESRIPPLLPKLSQDFGDSASSDSVFQEKESESDLVSPEPSESWDDSWTIFETVSRNG